MDMALDSIVRSYKINNGQSTLHFYLREMKFLVDFLRKFALKHSFLDKTVVLKLDQKKSIPFPEDFVMWSIVGWQSGDRIIGFERDGTVNLSHSTIEDGNEAPIANLSYNNAQWPYSGRTLTFNNFTTTTGEVGSLTGYGLGWNGLGYFRVNWKDREIQFSSEVPSDFEIYLCYKSNGFQAKTSSVIPEVAAKLGEDYIHWQMALYSRQYGASSAETEARRINYFREYDEMIAITEPITPSALAGIRARGYDVNKLVH